MPFGRYYGSIDATPLFVLLLGEYFRRTGDLATVRSLWPNAEAALAWMDRYGDRDGDGFVEYFRQTQEGLANQGWKDSYDAIFHHDGQMAEGPIALCEVQGYVYGAKRHARVAGKALGYAGRAAELASQAEALRQNFEARFWCDESIGLRSRIGRREEPCRVVSSNAGQVLFTGIASAERAARLARTLLSPTMFSGWGIRTVASTEARYNPMSYHNGSVWPHDNGLIAMGLARYGLTRCGVADFSGIFRRRDLHGFAAPAGVVLRLRPPRPQCADPISRRLLSAGLGERGAAVLASILARPRTPRPHRRSEVLSPHIAELPRPRALAQSAPDERLGRCAAAPGREEHFGHRHAPRGRRRGGGALLVACNIHL